MIIRAIIHYSPLWISAAAARETPNNKCLYRKAPPIDPRSRIDAEEQIGIRGRRAGRQAGRHRPAETDRWWDRRDGERGQVVIYLLLSQ